MTPSPSTSLLARSALPPTLAAWMPGEVPPVDGLGLTPRPELASSTDLGPIPGTSLADALISSAVEVLPVAFLASCHRCAPGLSEPFFDVVERDGWVVKHAESTGHLVHLGVDVDPGDGVHHAALLRFFAHGSMWRWACLSCADLDASVVGWNGPYDTGQSALASWRAHGRRSALEVIA